MQTTQENNHKTQQHDFNSEQNQNVYFLARGLGGGVFVGIVIRCVVTAVVGIVWGVIVFSINVFLSIIMNVIIAIIGIVEGVKNVMEATQPLVGIAHNKKFVFRPIMVFIFHNGHCVDNVFARMHAVSVVEQTSFHCQ